MARKNAAPLKNVYLCGFMCAGKSSSGRELARLLKRPFADTDAMAEKAANLSVAKLAASRGLAAFRKLELAALREAAGRGGLVVALGGGLYPRGRKADLFRRTGVTVFLSCPWQELEPRLRRARGGRPRLAGPWPVAAARAKALLGRRLPWYRKADLTVNTAGLTPREAAAAIRGALGDRLL